MNRKTLSTGLFAATGVAVLLGLHGAISPAAEPAAPPAMPAVAPAPAGQYQVDKSHASIQLRVSHLGFSTYTTRFSRFDAELTFDPSNLPASKVVATIDASSLALEEAPAICLDIVKGPKMMTPAQFPRLV